MVSPLSVGDCIAVANLVVTGVRALSQSHGAVAEYQALDKDINYLVETLEAIKNIQWDPPLTSEHVIQRITNDHQALLLRFQKRISRFDGSLGNGRSNGIIRDTFRKLWWAFCLKKKMNDLRCSILNRVTILTSQLPLQNMLGVLLL